MFDAEEACVENCVSPAGSGVCYLDKVTGPCDGRYDAWYFDAASGRCGRFAYGGCLGNANRFETREECEAACKVEDEKPVCEQPKAAGACKGRFLRCVQIANVFMSRTVEWKP